jgi:hypothetical protein
MKFVIQTAEISADNPGLATIKHYWVRPAMLTIELERIDSPTSKADKLTLSFYVTDQKYTEICQNIRKAMQNRNELSFDELDFLDKPKNKNNE